MHYAIAQRARCCIARARGGASPTHERARTCWKREGKQPRPAQAQGPIITCGPFTVDIELENQGCSRARRGTVGNRKRVRRGTFDTRVLQSTTLGVAEHNASVEEREHMTGRRGFAQYC